mgnify:CR=1 FL=1
MNSYYKMNIKLLILFQLIIFCSCKDSNQHKMPVENHAIRLKPGSDLKKSIQDYINNNHIKAGWIATCAGSLTHYNIRFANQPNGTADSGHFEIVSLSGTVSENGSHLHISISDSTGKTMGGHLLENNIIYTTAEIVIQSTDEMEFKREKDGTTPWEELQVIKKSN